MKHVVERAIVPYNPSTSSIINKEQYNLFAPVAGTNRVGMAAFSNDDFIVRKQTVALNPKIYEIIAKKVAKTDIVDTLDNADTTKVLAASVGAKIIKAISDAVQGKITAAELTAALKSYVTTSSLNTTLESYVLKKDLDMSGSGISDEMKEILTDVYESNGSLGLEYDLSFGVCLGIGDCKYTDIVVGNVVRGTTISKMRTQAFEGTHITSVELLDSQWLLFGYTFKNCYDLKNAILGNGTVNIAYQDFCDCVNLERISIPKTVTYIGEECFAGCVKLADVYFEGTIAEWNAIEIDIGNEYLTNARIHCSDGTFNLEV